MFHGFTDRYVQGMVSRVLYYEVTGASANLAKSFTKLVQQPPSIDKQCLLSHSTTVFWLSQIYGLICFVSLRYVFAVSSVVASSSPGFNKQCQEMILVNKEGNSWPVSLRFSESDGMYYIKRGWKKFCLDNRCDIGDLLVFNLVGDGKTVPLLCVCPERKECAELLNKYLSRKSGK
ncbi:hypothetical protein Bca52824_018803 [Brassica carinata]|uniref:TF-B3 domain-containing protein n=1 Tax=Brassica carinata TaxID=52824 RepID=A0A8X7VQM4_BRACI|nr:hypothetical protein Bca52824_018803 [Brassica carinata]